MATKQEWKVYFKDTNNKQLISDYQNCAYHQPRIFSQEWHDMNELEKEILKRMDKSA